MFVFNTDTIELERGKTADRYNVAINFHEDLDLGYQECMNNLKAKAEDLIDKINSKAAAIYIETDCKTVEDLETVGEMFSTYLIEALAGEERHHRIAHDKRIKYIADNRALIPNLTFDIILRNLMKIQSFNVRFTSTHLKKQLTLFNGGRDD